MFIPANLPFGVNTGVLEQTHPEIDAHGRDEAASQKGCIFKTNQQAGLPHARVPDQHHLHGGNGGNERKTISTWEAAVRTSTRACRLSL